MNRWMRNSLMGEAGSGEGAGGAGGAAGDGAAAGAAGGTALSAGAEGAAGDGAVADLIPEKYRVMSAEGVFDLEASARKQAEGYAALSKKLGAGVEGAPETPEAYAPKVEVEGFQWDEFKSNEKMAGFLKRFHAKGINNEQLSEVLSAYHEIAPDLIETTAAQTMQQCEATLKGVWATEAEYQANIKGAVKMVQAAASKAGLDANEVIQSDLGNHPMFLRLMAGFASELGEDRLPAAQGTPSAQSIEDLLRSEAYTNPKHADHAKVSQQVQAYYAKKFGSAPAL